MLETGHAHRPGQTFSPPMSLGAPAPVPPPEPTSVPEPGTTVDSSPASTPRRDTTFDRIKGLGIAEVMVHHILGVTQRKFAEPGTPAWWTMATLSQILHFAVPVFLMVSAILLVRSVAKSEHPDWRNYLVRRLRRTVVPFLVWSIAYIAFRILVLTDPGESDTPTVRAKALLAPSLVATYLIWGKSYFHLYFFAILIQLSLSVPVLIALVRKLPSRFPVVALSALGLQALVHQLHGKLFTFPYPAATLAWYLPAVLCGTWIGLHWHRWPDLRKTLLPAAAIMAVPAFAAYLPLALRARTGATVPNFAYQTAATLWTTSLGWVLLSTASRWSPRIGAPLGWLGERSLGLFVVHPLAIYFLGGPKITRLLATIPLPAVIYGLLVVTASIAAVEAIRRTPLRHILLAS